jgi:hypothetical protein
MLWPTGGRRGCGATDLGLLLVEPRSTGLCQITLTYDGGAEARWTVVAQWMGARLPNLAAGSLIRRSHTTKLPADSL